MRPKKRRETGQSDLLRSRLDAIIDMGHPLVKLGRTIDWSFLEQRFGAVYEDKPGRPPLPTRLMAVGYRSIHAEVGEVVFDKSIYAVIVDSSRCSGPVRGVRLVKNQAASTNRGNISRPCKEIIVMDERGKIVLALVIYGRGRAGFAMSVVK